MIFKTYNSNDSGGRVLPKRQNKQLANKYTKRTFDIVSVFLFFGFCFCFCFVFILFSIFLKTKTCFNTLTVVHFKKP